MPLCSKKGSLDTWFKMVQAANAHYVRNNINTYANSRMNSTDSSFHMYNASMIACQCDCDELLEITMLKELKTSYFKRYTYLSDVYFQMPPKSTILHLCVVYKSRKCLRLILETMQLNTLFCSYCNQFNKLNQHALSMLCFINDVQIKQMMLSQLYLFAPAFTARPIANNPLLYTVRLLDVQTLKMYLIVGNVEGLTWIHQTIKESNILEYLHRMLLKKKYHGKINQIQAMIELITIYMLSMHGKSQNSSFSCDVRFDKVVPSSYHQDVERAIQMRREQRSNWAILHDPQFIQECMDDGIVSGQNQGG